MNGRMIDIAIVGGGLAGGLTALALHRAHPELRLALFEAGAQLGGNHRWSWFASDLDPAGAALIADFRKTEWDSGYEVSFPAFARTLASPYRSLDSRDFAAALHRQLPADTIRLRSRVTTLDADVVTLEGGESLPARVVIDCRDFTPSRHLTGGWQVFMGRHLRTRAPHGLSRPLVMDARVAQHDGYRFVYTLPLGAHELFVEDTCYADRPMLDRSALSHRIDEYCAAMGWQGDILGGETGVLPVITGGDFAACRRELGPPGVVRIGARAGFVHPLTSYSVPFAVANALRVAREAMLPGEQLAALFEARARRHWRDTAFYRRLGRMLFGGARPERRYRMFEHFYRLPRPLIERFYAGRSTAADRMHVLMGRPPIPVPAAIAALLGKGTPLVHEDRR
ncbi:MAG: lycopene beta-cyclase CrtY [Erythrobacter sp.]|jgi:lycopene beta-cyclase